VRFEDRPQARAHHVMVVRDQNPRHGAPRVEAPRLGEPA
jgi:hypothetical protein